MQLIKTLQKSKTVWECMQTPLGIQSYLYITLWNSTTFPGLEAIFHEFCCNRLRLNNKKAAVVNKKRGQKQTKTWAMCQILKASWLTTYLVLVLHASNSPKCCNCLTQVVALAIFRNSGQIKILQTNINAKQIFHIILRSDWEITHIDQ